MKTEDIQKKYERLVYEIENRFSDSDVPQPIQHYYLLCSLISARSFEKFYKNYGKAFIDDFVAAVGKDEYLGIDLLDDFEIETIVFWRKFCNERRNQPQIQKLNY